MAVIGGNASFRWFVLWWRCSFRGAFALPHNLLWRLVACACEQHIYLVLEAPLAPKVAVQVHR